MRYLKALISGLSDNLSNDHQTQEEDMIDSMGYEDFDYGLDDCELEGVIPRAQHEDAACALWEIMEMLYNSANAIDEQKLRGSFAYLCDALHVSDRLLAEPDGLCVVHYKEAMRLADMLAFRRERESHWVGLDSSIAQMQG